MTEQNNFINHKKRSPLLDVPLIRYVEVWTPLPAQVTQVYHQAKKARSLCHN